jgi:hypothetical protein
MKVKVTALWPFFLEKIRPTAHLILHIWMDTTKLVEVLLERKSDGHAHLHNLTWSPSLVPCEIRFGIEVE